MAILESSPKTGTCPKCGSNNVEVEFKKTGTNKASTIVKKSIKCNDCGYER
jgi:C4-type Zn-finger protein